MCQSDAIGHAHAPPVVDFSQYLIVSYRPEKSDSASAAQGDAAAVEIDHPGLNKAVMAYRAERSRMVR
jgi:MOSC domain-containing protein YiiM